VLLFSLTGAARARSSLASTTPLWKEPDGSLPSLWVRTSPKISLPEHGKGTFYFDSLQNEKQRLFNSVFIFEMEQHYATQNDEICIKLFDFKCFDWLNCCKMMYFFVF